MSVPMHTGCSGSGRVALPQLVRGERAGSAGPAVAPSANGGVACLIDTAVATSRTPQEADANADATRPRSALVLAYGEERVPRTHCSRIVRSHSDAIARRRHVRGKGILGRVQSVPQTAGRSVTRSPGCERGHAPRAPAPSSRSRAALRSSMGRKVSIARSAAVTSSGAPRVAITVKRLTSPSGCAGRATPRAGSRGWSADRRADRTPPPGSGGRGPGRHPRGFFASTS
jgi:hypothetical protein